MEGVMMQGPERIAMAVRRPDGKVALTVKPVKKITDKYPFLGWPVLRGVVNFVMQMKKFVFITTTPDNLKKFQ